MGDNLPKGGLIPHTVSFHMKRVPKSAMTLEEGLAAYQLVGGVMAYQFGDDG